MCPVADIKVNCLTMTPIFDGPTRVNGIPSSLHRPVVANSLYSSKSMLTCVASKFARSSGGQSLNKYNNDAMDTIFRISLSANHLASVVA